MTLGLLCDGCSAFLPGRTQARATFTYWRDTDSGAPEMLEKHFCHECADIEAVRQGLIGASISDDDPFAVPGDASLVFE